MEYIYKTKGTCSKEIKFEINDNIITNIRFKGGCNGNLQAIAKLVDGLSASEIDEKLRGIKCGTKETSCADQLAKAVNKAINEKK